jgi:hypothetical protein
MPEKSGAEKASHPQEIGARGLKPKKNKETVSQSSA